MPENKVQIVIEVDNATGIARIKGVGEELDKLSGKASETSGKYGQLSGASERAATSALTLSTAIGALAGSFAALKIAQYVKDAALLAARYETLGVVMRVVGSNAGYSGSQMEAYAKSLEKTGISMTEARQSLARMVQANMDLAQASRLARVAQDAAVIGNINSSEAFQRLVYGIQSAQTEMLRTIGINVNFEASYQRVAKATGRTAAQLSETEKAQIRMSTAMDAGERTAGTYSAAIDTAGKQLTSLPRHLENLKVLFGQAFTPALAEVIKGITRALTDLNDELTRTGAARNWGDNLRAAVLTAAGGMQALSASVLTLYSSYLKIKAVALWFDSKTGGSPGRTPEQGKALGEAAARDARTAEAAAADLMEKASKNLSITVADFRKERAAADAAEVERERKLAILRGIGRKGVADPTADTTADKKAAKKAAKEAADLQKERERLLDQKYAYELKIALAIAQTEEDMQKAGVDGAKTSTATYMRLEDDRWEQELKVALAIAQAEEDMKKAAEDGAKSSTATFISETDQLLQDKMALYKDLAGFEDEYRAAQLEWIGKIRRAEIAAGLDTAAADKKAAAAIAKVDQATFEAKTAQVSSALGQMQSTFQTIGGMYDKNSEEYARMQEAAKVMMVLQQAVAVANAVAAIANQGLGDPYTAFARIAAMAAAMGSLLASTGLSFGGGVSAPTAAFGLDTTVLGGENGQGSESITKSWELLQDTYDMENTKLTGIYNQMKDLNANITGVVKAIVLGDIANIMAGQVAPEIPGWRAFDEKYFGQGIAKMETKFMDAIENIPVVGNILSKVVSFLVGGSGGEKSLVASGIRVAGGSVAPYNVVHTAGVNSSWGFGGSDQYDTTTVQAANDALTAFFYGPYGLSTTIGKMFYDVAGELGGDASIAKQTITDAFMNIGDINLIGLDTSDKIEAKIKEEVSKLEDIAARSIFGDDFINKYIKTNEAAAETVFRLYVDLIDMTDILSMTGKTMTGTKVTTIELSESLIDIAGGLDKLTEAAGAYYDKFFSDEEKQIRLTGWLTESMAAMNLILPQTRAGYRAIVEALDITTESGKEAYVAMLQLAESADQYYSYLDDGQTEYFNNLADLLESLQAQSEGIDQWISGMNRSTLAPVQSAESWQVEYDRQLAAAKSTDATSQDVSGFLSYAKEYLDFQRAYGDENSYQAIYGQVMGDASGLKTGVDAQLEIAQKQLDALNLIATNTGATAAGVAATSTEAQVAVDAIYSKNNDLEGWTVADLKLIAKGLKIEDYYSAADAQSLLAENGYEWGTYASGGYADRPAIFGEAGGEWAVPTYEPERSRFLESAPPDFWGNLGVSQPSTGNVLADADAIGRSVAAQLRPFLAALSSAGPGAGGKIELHVHLDGREIASSVENQLRQGHRGLVEQTRRIARVS